MNNQNLEKKRKLYSVKKSIEDIDNNIKRATEKLSFLSKFIKAKKEENEWKVLHYNSIRGETREIDEKIALTIRNLENMNIDYFDNWDNKRKENIDFIKRVEKDN